MRSASVVRLVPKRERVSREAAAVLADALGSVPAGTVPEWALQQVLHSLHRITSPATEGGIWPGGFVMLSRDQLESVWNAIEALPPGDRPRTVDKVFKLVLLNLRTDTGEVMLTRDQLADRVGCSSGTVSKAMGVLIRFGVIEREVRRVEGLRGPGVVAYFINPHCAWNGSLSIRQERAARAAQPSLTLVGGA